MRQVVSEMKIKCEKLTSDADQNLKLCKLPYVCFFNIMGQVVSEMKVKLEN